MYTRILLLICMYIHIVCSLVIRFTLSIMLENISTRSQNTVPSDRTIVQFYDYIRTYTRYIRASDSRRCVGTLEAPTSYGNNRLCLRAVGARKLVEILIKGAIPLLPTDKYELHPQCPHPLPPRPLFTVSTNENGKNVLCYTSYGATSLRLSTDQD